MLADHQSVEAFLPAIARLVGFLVDFIANWFSVLDFVNFDKSKHTTSSVSSKEPHLNLKEICITLCTATIDKYLCITLCTVRLTSIHYRVSGNQNFCFAPTETIDGRVKKKEVPLVAWSDDWYLLRYTWW